MTGNHNQETTALSPMSLRERNVRRALLLFLLTPTTLGAAAPADEATDPAADTYVIHDEVFVEERAPEPGSNTIAAKLPLSLAQTPIAVGEVTAERIELTGSDVLGDALASVAGVNVQSGNGIFDVYMLRGLDSTSGLVLTDGTREPQVTFFQLYNIERVEVVKGPMSFLYGALSMSGAINLVRKQPRTTSFTRFGLAGGSFSTLKGNLDANYAGDDHPPGGIEGGRHWGLRLNAEWRESDLYRDQQRTETFAVNPAFRFQASERTTVYVNLEAIDISARPDAGLPLDFTHQVPDVPRKRSYDAPFSRSDQKAYRFQVDVESRLSEDFVLRNKTYYRSLDWDSNSTVLNGVFPDFAGSLFVARTQLLLDDSQSFVGNQLEALYRSGSHNLLFGLETAELNDEFTFDVGLIPGIDLFAPVETATEPFILPGQSFGADATSVIVAPYVVDQIRVSDRVQLTIGARFDTIDFEDKATGAERSDSQLSPLVGAVFSPSKRLSFYVNAGTAFAPQSTFVVFEDREPEESEQVELGIRTRDEGGRFELAVAAYRLDRDKVAIPDETGITRQTGSQRSQGLELELAARLGPKLQARLAYTYTDAELTQFTEQVLAFDPVTFQPIPVTIERTGNVPAWVPEHILDLSLVQEVGSGWTIAAGGRWVSEQAIAADNAFFVDEHFLLDAVVAYARDTWRAQVNLDNLTGEETFTRVFNSSSVVPAPGFSVTAGLQFQF